jgi:glycine hydroxymethyltransferase
VDLRPKGVTGKAAEEGLERANITCNKNGIPFDPAPPAITSGLRLGTPAGTTRGFGEAEFARIGELIAQVVDGMVQAGEGGDSVVEDKVRAEVRDLTGRFPIYI